MSHFFQVIPLPGSLNSLSMCLFLPEFPASFPLNAGKESDIGEETPANP